MGTFILLAAMVTITEADADKQVRVQAGEVFAVHLLTTRGTGFKWLLKKHDGLEQVGDRQYRGAKPGTKGGTETVIIKFKTTQAGKHDLRFEYRRGFEKDKPPTKVFKTTVIAE